MATFTNFLAKHIPYLTPITKTTPLNLINPQFSTLPSLPSKPRQNPIFKLDPCSRSSSAVKAFSAADDVEFKTSRHERVQKVNNTEEFGDALVKAKNRLVVVEFAASDSENNNQIYRSEGRAATNGLKGQESTKAKNRLVVVEFATIDSENSSQIYRSDGRANIGGVVEADLQIGGEGGVDGGGGQ